MSDEQKTAKKVYKRPLFHKIVNVFIGLVAGLLFLLIIFFGFSQTKTFRNFLKNQITEAVSNSINGNLLIDELEGSILSSIIIKNAKLVTENDTLLKVEQLTVKTSPIHILLKRILIREISITNAYIKLTEDKSGNWSFSKLFNNAVEGKPDVEKDSSNSNFPFSIQINDLQVVNLNFYRETFENLNSTKYYKHLTTNDLRLKNINLSAKLFANLNSSTLRMYLNNFSANPNFDAFALKKFSGNFEFTEDHALFNNLHMITDSSDIKLNIKVDELNLLGNIKLREFKDYPLNVKFDAYPLTFSDLYTFIDDVDFLNGGINLNLEADGYFGDFSIRELNMNFRNSLVNATGEVKNLHIPDKLFLDVEIKDSRIIETEAHEIIKGLDIPKYDGLILENLDVKFKGEPTRFHSTLAGNIDKGELFIDTYLDLQTEEMEYDTEFRTKDLNLFSLLGINSSLNSFGKIRGIGTDPNNMTAEFNVQSSNSIIDSIVIDSTYFQTTINSKLLDVNLSTKINNADLSIRGKLNLLDKDEPVYDLIGSIRNLNLKEFSKDDRDSSDLNLNFVAKGKNLDIDKMVGEYELTLNSSNLRDIELTETGISLLLQKENEERQINLKSDFVDFNIEGIFSLEKAFHIIKYEAFTISDVISYKLEELNPINEQDTTLIITNNQNDIIPAIAKENLEFEYNFLFKDFEIVSLFIDNEALDIIGSGEGRVINDSLHFEISTDVYIENLLSKTKDDILYLSNIEAGINFSRDNREISFNKMFGSVSLEGEKIYSGTEINNLTADLVFNQSKLFINTSFDLGENLSAELEGIATTSLAEERIDFSNIYINYKNIPWTNYDTCNVLFSDGGVQISNLIFENGATVIDADGQLNDDESHSFYFNIESMPGALLSNYILDDEGKMLEGDFNLQVVSTGFLFNPDIDLDLNIYNIAYDGVNFGSLTGVASHKEGNTLIDIDFDDVVDNNSVSLLMLDGMIPMNINYLDLSNIFDNNSELVLSLKSNDFNIGSLGNVLPFIKNQSGILKSKIDVKGSPNNLNWDGYLNLSDARFTVRENNLNYSLNLNTVFVNQIGSVENITISNRSGSKYRGTVTGNGIVELSNLPFSKIDLDFRGNLALLGKNSKTRNSNIYGDLLVKSKDKWSLKFDGTKYIFTGDIIVDRADLVYTYQNTSATQNRNFIYRIIEDSSRININTQRFTKIVNASKLDRIDLVKENPTLIALNTKIIIDNIASFIFILSPDLNQKLNVETTGEIEFESVGTETKAQGALTLLSGSRLEFFKAFDAKGTIRFENNITDPYFDIVATYLGEIENFENQGNTEEVAVKLKLNTAYSKLRENLSANSSNIDVYTGRDDIESDIPDPKYDESNALTFVIFDQLDLDLNAEQKSTLGAMTENAAFSLLGSQLTSYLNSTLGGIISNIKLNRYSGRDSYKLLFSGKYNNIRYSFGGSFGSQTDYLQLSKADIKVEYLFNRNFLIRIEQKDPIIKTTAEEKIQEVGLKYKFEF